MQFYKITVEAPGLFQQTFQDLTYVTYSSGVFLVILRRNVCVSSGKEDILLNFKLYIFKAFNIADCRYKRCAHSPYSAVN